MREGIGVIGKPEYAPPGIRLPLVDFQLDPQGNPIVQMVPSACLLGSLPEASVREEAGAGIAPAWRGESANCKSSGWQEVSLLSDSSGAEAARYLPEQKWFRGIAEHAGYVILRLRYYPAWAVKVNGIPVRGMAEQDRGLMAVPVPKGNVLVSVEWSTTGDVVGARWVSGVALLLVAGLFVFEQKGLWAHLHLGKPNSLISTEDPKLPKVEPKHPVPSTRTDRRNTPSGKQPKNARQEKARKPKRGDG
jgi:hypothetical protein